MAADPGPAPDGHGQGPRRRGLVGRIGDRIVLRLHRMADRMNLIPTSFDTEAHVDEDDPQAVRAAWVRHLRDWAAYNPEEVFALKVGGAMLLAGILFFWLAIALLL